MTRLRPAKQILDMLQNMKAESYGLKNTRLAYDWMQNARRKSRLVKKRDIERWLDVDYSISDSDSS